MTAKELGICMIAHRGYSGKYHQNTRLAFEKAAEHGSGGAETDIRMTKDGVLVCSHNSEAVFCDGTELIVADSTYAQLIEKPLKNTKGLQEVYLCLFSDYLKVMKENDMICFVELKGVFDDGQLKAVFDMVEDIYSLDRCILQSFDFDNLVRTHAIVPKLRLMYTYGTEEKDYERCFDYGFSLDADQKVITPEMIKEFHDRGLEVGVWTANTEQDFARCKTLGVDYIESDYFGGND